MIDITYSLIFLNGVRPTPSIKQTGKIRHKKIDMSKIEEAIKYPRNTNLTLRFRRKNRGAMRNDRLWIYLAAIQNWVGKFVPYPSKMAIPL